MLALTAKLSRAESARINGAKSNGPKTSAGLFRSQTANFKDGLYAVRDYNLPGESNEEFAELQVRIHGYWQPNGFPAGQLVEQLAGNIWEANRVQASKSGYLHRLLAVIARNSPHCVGQAKLNLEAEKQASVAGGAMDRSNARLGHLARERNRIERELLRLEKRSCTSGWSQKSLKTNNRRNTEIPASDDAKPSDGAISESPFIVEAGDAPLPKTITNQDLDPKKEEAPKNIINLAFARWQILRLDSAVFGLWNLPLADNAGIHRFNRQIDQLNVRIGRLERRLKFIQANFRTAINDQPVEETNESDKSIPFAEYSPETVAFYQRYYPRSKIIIMPPNAPAQGVTANDRINI